MTYRYYDTVFKRYLYTSAESIYICGPTLYRSIHIGNLRPIIFGDYLNRALNTQYITNITDIDNKILNLTKIKNYFSFMKMQYLKFRKLQLALGIKSHKEYSVFKDMDIIIRYVERPRKNINTNKVGDVRLHFKYNHISNNPGGSFTVWKKTERGFNCTRGQGLPGWHTECAAFIDHINTPLSLHGGGKDLKDIHHQNECHLLRHHQPQGWIHTGMVKTGGKKMSKSIQESVILAETFILRHGIIRMRLLFMNTVYHDDINMHPGYYDEIENLNRLFHWSNALSKGIYSPLLQMFCNTNTFEYNKLVQLIKRYKYTNPTLTLQIFHHLGIKLEFNYKIYTSVLNYYKGKYNYYYKRKNFKLSDQYRSIFQPSIYGQYYNYSMFYDITNNKTQIDGKTNTIKI